MKLNGWKRIGIVATVVWAIGGYFHEFDSLFDSAVGTYATIDEHCVQRAADGASQTVDQCDQAMEQSMHEATSDAREAALYVALIPIPLAWGGVYFVLFLSRWIKRGFVPASAGLESTENNNDLPNTLAAKPRWSRVQILIGGGVIILLVWLVYGRIEASRVVADEQHTIADLTAKHKVLDDKPSFELQSRCSEAAKQFFNREWSGSGQDSDYTSHYNPEMRKCFTTVKTSQWQKATGTVLTSKNVYDAVEGKTYGEYVWQSDPVKKWWEVPPIQCDGVTPEGVEMECHSEGEYENLMSKYMDVSD
jgi:hypothetical protein